MSVKYVVDAFKVKAVLGEELFEKKKKKKKKKSIVNPNWNLSKSVELIQIGLYSET